MATHRGIYCLFKLFRNSVEIHVVFFINLYEISAELSAHVQSLL